jgi:hypothetical protein
MGGARIPSEDPEASLDFLGGERRQIVRSTDEVAVVDHSPISVRWM